MDMMDSSPPTDYFECLSDFMCDLARVELLHRATVSPKLVVMGPDYSDSDELVRYEVMPVDSFFKSAAQGNRQALEFLVNKLLLRGDVFLVGCMVTSSSGEVPVQTMQLSIFAPECQAARQVFLRPAGVGSTVHASRLRFKAMRNDGANYLPALPR